MRIFGIDPSVLVCGWSLIEYSDGAASYIDSDTIFTNPAENISIRLYKLMKKFHELLDEHRPDAISIEEVFLRKDIGVVFKLSYVRGIILALAGDRKIPVIEVAPVTVKKVVTGNGKSGKAQVRNFVVKVVHNNGIRFSSYDESDALAIAYCAGVVGKF
ncbi:crossover junction endodeoxyribonuclease RuvC [Candidatus Sneabacter namystus]|uniref:crossover junction endodeoxyribonuclease n=1 Tax=Candidatus Sneabacter namystus TaxID=2601646 RepID=A0A5C0UJ87_9RICK|nr:crossover junction endodeoxyribonuclease RuvC [Candidatus Sneabacter namystus]QEK39847.1 crossover junction endodeoxyribonuclease RuvC [Candidatus Sneabacter namystus]